MLSRVLALLLPALILGAPNAARADDEGPAPASALVDDVLAYLGFGGSHKEDLRQGKVIYTGMPDLEVVPNQLADLRDDMAVGGERHFYVTHSYDSAQTLIGVALFEDGTLVFGAISTFTDKVTGLAGGLKKTFGRDIVGTELAERFERLRQRLEQ